MADLDLSALHDIYTSEEQVKEATAFKTLPTGAYRFHVEKADPRTDDRPDSETPGRQTARITAAAFDPLTGDRKGTTFFNVSWQPFKREDRAGILKQDGPTKLWGQLVKALEAQDQSVADVVQTTIYSAPVDGFLIESMKMPDGSLQGFKTPEERVALLKDGGEPMNYVANLRKAK